MSLKKQIEQVNDKFEQELSKRDKIIAFLVKNYTDL